MREGGCVPQGLTEHERMQAMIDVVSEAVERSGYPGTVTTRTHKEQTVAKDPEVKEAEANLAVAEEPRSDEVKCDNHPGRKARTFTGDNSYLVNLCEECTPSWFKE